MTFSVPVGWPLASLRAGASQVPSLLHLLQKAADKYGRHTSIHLLVFIDCFILLDILLKRGRSIFMMEVSSTTKR